MHTPLQTVPTPEIRAGAIAAAMRRIRAIADAGISREGLSKIENVVIALAERAELFPREQFPLGPNGAPRVYYLGQDDDGRFAIYASAGAPGKRQPPHDHTTWAVISGIYGEEHNVLYRRLAGDTLEVAREITVRRGNAVGLLPDDVHTIRVVGSELSLHLHVYGRSLEQLPERVTFESERGGNAKPFPANPNITSPRMSPRDLKGLIGSHCEYALLDVRSEEAYGAGHPLFASSLPLESFEARVGKLVPRRTACIVVYDDGDGAAERASALLRKLGYKNVSILEGGLQAWRAAGFEVFSGFNVLSKAFGEVVERRYGTPHIDARELRRMLEDGSAVVVLDSRPFEEFRNMSVPSAVSCPGAELLYRGFDAVADDALVVVSCAGRTRSILGAQSLINAEFPHRVVALRNGTMGWELAGFALERGAARRAAPPGPQGAARAREAAHRVARRFGVKTIDRSALREMQQQDQRTLYIFDVRTPEEYRAGHLVGARSAPGGQLLQAVDLYAAVHHARIVLVDSDGVRARMTASWLVQMGDAEVYVLTEGDSSPGSERGDEPGWMPSFGDTRHKPYGSAAEMHAYLTWETALVDAVRRDGDAAFLQMLEA